MTIFCEKRMKLGNHGNEVGFSLPLGLLIHKPGSLYKVISGLP